MVVMLLALLLVYHRFTYTLQMLYNGFTDAMQAVCACSTHRHFMQLQTNFAFVL